MIPKKYESKYVSALPTILNGPSLQTWQSAMSSIIFGPFRLLGNAHLLNWLFWWPMGVDMWCRLCRPEVRIRRQVREKIRRISNLPKTFEVKTLSNLNVNFVTSLSVNLLTYLLTYVSSRVAAAEATRWCWWNRRRFVASRWSKNSQNFMGQPWKAGQIFTIFC